VAHGPWKTELDFGGNSDHVTLGLGSWYEPTHTHKVLHVGASDGMCYPVFVAASAEVCARLTAIPFRCVYYAVFLLLNRNAHRAREYC